MTIFDPFIEIPVVAFPDAAPPADTDDEAALDGYAALTERIHRQREELERALRDAHEFAEDPADADPVLQALARFAAVRDAADRQVRHLVIYARNFLPAPLRSYRELAAYAGKSESWVGVVAGNSEEHDAVAAALANARKAAEPDPEAHAMAAMRILDGLSAGAVAEILTDVEAKLATMFPRLTADQIDRVAAHARNRYTHEGA